MMELVTNNLAAEQMINSSPVFNAGRFETELCADELVVAADIRSAAAAAAARRSVTIGGGGVSKMSAAARRRRRTALL